jgi:4'-phosphopantetheinyl transferase
MSLASQLLKYYFIHRTCLVPWNEISISRTPAPHKRPCYIPPAYPSPPLSPTDVINCPNGTKTKFRKIPNVEFNVSHQASFIALAGCEIPDDADVDADALSSTSASTSASIPITIGNSASRRRRKANNRVLTTVNPGCSPDPSTPQVGIDVTCTDESARRRPNSVPTNEQAFADFVNIFSDVFSLRELTTIKFAYLVQPDTRERIKFKSKEEEISARLRLFYAYWALKEAYIKMTGEALLAPWLKQLEFRNVIAPDPVSPYSTHRAEERNGVRIFPNGHQLDQHTDSSTRATNEEGGVEGWGQPYRGVETWLHNRRVTDVRMELIAFQENFLVATAVRGGGLGSESEYILNGSNQKRTTMKEEIGTWNALRPLDIESDIAPCAKGECKCLSDEVDSE